MKKVIIILIGIILLLGSCTTQSAQTTSRYTANQVIQIVQAKYPEAYRNRDGTILKTTPSITATYVDNQVWEVFVKAPDGYRLVSWQSNFTYLTVYFYEGNGSLWKGYDAAARELVNPVQ